MTPLDQNPREGKTLTVHDRRESGGKNHPTILIVNQAKGDREILLERLGKHGYRFISAENARQAITVLKKHPEVDIILLDLVLPSDDSLAFLAWHEKKPHIRTIPLIAGVSDKDFESLAIALTMGAYDFFTKPIAPKDLDIVIPIKIKNAITSRRLLRETQRQNEIMKQQLETAARYQKFLLPKQTDLPGVDVTYMFRPSTEVGGDYFDFFPLPGGEIGFVVADVSGHGPASAMTASIIKALLPGYLANYRSPGRALTELNREVFRLTMKDVYVTAFASLYDPKTSRLTWSMAGHPPPLFFSNGETRLLSMESFFLAVFDNDNSLIDYPDQNVQVGAGDRLFAYTDGLVEAPNPQGLRYGPARLKSVLENHRHRNITDLREIIQKDLTEFAQGELPDDVAFILVGF